VEIEMKYGILRAALLGVVASASFSLTQAASLAATASYPTPTTATNTCAVVNPAKAASRNGAAPDVDPAIAVDKLLLGGN
jgi:hypothetical protein